MINWGQFQVTCSGYIQGLKFRITCFLSKQFFFPDLPSSKLTWQWKMDHELNEDVFPLEKNRIFHPAMSVYLEVQ